jgi:5-methylcytosine-specific restriction protein B
VIAQVRRPGVLRDVGPTVLEKFNEWIRSRLGREFVIGHSFFVSQSVPDRPDAFDRLWTMDIGPLLEEYFFGDEAGLTEATTRWHTIVKGELSARDAMVRDALEEAASEGQ